MSATAAAAAVAAVDRITTPAAIASQGAVTAATADQFTVADVAARRQAQ